MAVVVTQSDRESFLRCRRQWDLRAQMRRNLEPVTRPASPDLPAALHAALAVYYFPGMWDWDRGITIPLVRQGFERELSRQREHGASGEPEPDWARPLAAGHELLDRYFRWAPGADRFSPVLIASDFDVQVTDPASPGAGLTGTDRQPVRFRGRIHMLAVDEHDAYWLVRHRVLTAGGWPATASLAADRAALADAWAWEQFYLGLAIVGTIHNELLLGAPGPLAAAADRLPGAPGPLAVPDRLPDASRASRPAGREWRPGWLRRRRRDAPEAAAPVIRQHDPSGGGRSIPQHRRLYAQAREPGTAVQLEQVTAGEFRRTWVRHSPAAIAGAGRRLAADAAAMVAAGPAAQPNPGDANCRPCEFLQPCLAMRAGRDSEFLLSSGYRSRPPDILAEGRLGGGAWGLGRGAAPFRRG